MSITASMTIAYPAHMDFLDEIRPVVEDILGIQIPDLPSIADVGNTSSCLVDVELPDNFDIRGIKTQVNARLPDVNVIVATRFRKSIWEKRGMDVVIAITSGIAVALVIRAMQLLLGWP